MTPLGWLGRKTSTQTRSTLPRLSFRIHRVSAVIWSTPPPYTPPQKSAWIRAWAYVWLLSGCQVVVQWFEFHAVWRTQLIKYGDVEIDVDIKCGDEGFWNFHIVEMLMCGSSKLRWCWGHDDVVSVDLWIEDVYQMWRCEKNNNNKIKYCGDGDGVDQMWRSIGIKCGDVEHLWRSMWIKCGCIETPQCGDLGEMMDQMKRSVMMQYGDTEVSVCQVCRCVCVKTTLWKCSQFGSNIKVWWIKCGNAKIQHCGGQFSGERMCTILINRLEDYACPVKLWLGKLTALDMTQLGWLGPKTSTQTKLWRSVWIKCAFVSQKT